MEFYETTVQKFTPVMGVTPFVNWTTPTIAVILYLLGIAVMQRFMKNRKSINVSLLMWAHNWILCIVSVIMWVGGMYELGKLALTSKNSSSFETLFCDPLREQSSHGAVGFWNWVFLITKYYELLDTALQIAKKKNLLFLHVYHHAATLFTCFLGLIDNSPVQWIGLAVNAFIHILMYYYYAQASIGRDIWWKRYLTQMQITQFIGGLIVSVTWCYFKLTTPQGHCQGSWTIYFIGIVVVLSFLYLFCDFYIARYKKDLAGRKSSGSSKDNTKSE